jgi:uncharacterized protein YecE (DUF72 family)
MLRFGTSGYSYADWKGPYYPERIKDAEMLPFYAREFDTVEINYTYYRMPEARTLAAMADKVPPGFTFTVKANQEMTHDRDAGKEGFDDFLAALEPLRREGKLGCVLAQFPTSFQNTDENRDYLASFKERMRDVPTVVEFRHRSWADESIFAVLRALELGYCCVDQPRFRTLMPPLAEVTAPVAYVRFHGRNAKQWWHHEAAYERYSYSYSDEELGEWVPKIHALEAQAQVVYLFANNHYQGQSVNTVRQLKALLEPAPQAREVGR